MAGNALLLPSQVTYDHAKEGQLMRYFASALTVTSFFASLLLSCTESDSQKGTPTDFEGAANRAQIHSPDSFAKWQKQLVGDLELVTCFIRGTDLRFLDRFFDTGNALGVSTIPLERLEREVYVITRLAARSPLPRRLHNLELEFVKPEWLRGVRVLLHESTYSIQQVIGPNSLVPGDPILWDDGSKDFREEILQSKPEFVVVSLWAN